MPTKPLLSVNILYLKPSPSVSSGEISHTTQDPSTPAETNNQPRTHIRLVQQTEALQSQRALPI